MTNSRSACLMFSVLVGWLAVSVDLSPAWAQRGGGGNRGASAGRGGAAASAASRGGPRPSMGSVGASGAGRPTGMPTGGSRPNMGASAAARPNHNAPSLGNVSATRPAPGNPQRPSTARPGGLPTPPNMGGSRPGLGGAGASVGQRPNLPSNPAGGSPATRPSLPSATRPNIPDRPNVGNPLNPGNPGNAGRPTGPDFSNRPTVRPPSVAPPLNRPQNKLPDVQRPGTRPPGGLERPSTLPGNVSRPLPGNVSRPLPGDVSRPTNRPSKPSLGAGKPEVLPGSPDRPGPSGRPLPGRPEGGVAGRPTPLPGDITRPRPQVPNTRPDLSRPESLRPETGRPGSVRPNVPQRPTTLPAPIPSWGNQARPGFNNPGNVNINRPVIGGQRPNIGNNNNFNNLNFNNNQININTGNQFVNRPRWDMGPGFGRPAWGLGGPSWQARWHVNSVRFRFRWYNGCWRGHWGSAWYAPVAWVGVGWGLNSWSNGWGGQPYFNPYFAEPAVAQTLSYDYSQSVTINNLTQVDESGEEVEVPTTPAEEQALATVDDGLEKFLQGDYVQALSRFNTALRNLPGDAVVHEVRSLALFAVGDYKAAAAGLNSLLSAAPGMDWTTLSGLYGNVEDYTTQLRRLENFVEANPTDAAGNFVLAYHYLILDSKADAIEALRAVVKNQPQDITAKRMLAELDPVEPQATTTPETPPSDASESDPAQETDLVGKWQAEAGDAKIALSISEAAEFRWVAQTDGQTESELAGNIAGDVDGIELITSDSGTLAGTVRSLGPDTWVFRINGSPPSDQGLQFNRVE